MLVDPNGDIHWRTLAVVAIIVGVMVLIAAGYRYRNRR